MKHLLTADLSAPKGASNDEFHGYHDDLIESIYKKIKPYSTWEDGGESDLKFRESIELIIQKAKQLIKKDGKKINDLDFTLRFWTDTDRTIRPTSLSMGAISYQESIVLNTTGFTLNPVCVLEIGNEHKFLDNASDDLILGYLSAGRCAPILSLAPVKARASRPQISLFICDIQKYCPQVYYHGSNQKIPKGTVFGVRDWDSEFSPYVEAIIEHWRPANMASRIHGVFMVNDPIDVNPAGGSDKYVYRVQPLAPVHRHDFRFVQKVMALVQRSGFKMYDRRGGVSVAKQDMPQDLLKELIRVGKDHALSYWNGEMSDDWRVWEYLTNEAVILDLVPRSMYR